MSKSHWETDKRYIEYENDKSPDVSVAEIADVIAIREAIWEYYRHLDNRKNGVMSGDRCLSLIQDILDMKWEPGITRAT